MTGFEEVKNMWPECGCQDCVQAEAAFLLLSQRARIHHASKSSKFGYPYITEVVIKHLLSHTSPWFITENDDWASF